MARSMGARIGSCSMDDRSEKPADHGEVSSL
jgi:hypothetical protein